MGDNVLTFRRKNRVISLVAYALLPVLHSMESSGNRPYGRTKTQIWAYSGFASLLFGSRLLKPRISHRRQMPLTNSFRLRSPPLSRVL